MGRCVILRACKRDERYGARMPVSPADPSVAAVCRRLSDVYHSAVVVERWDRLEPWALARVLFSDARTEATVIVKWVRTDDGLARTESWRLRTELAALRFLSDDLGLRIAPRVIAADLSAGFLLLEDLAPRVALDRLLLRDGAATHHERLAAFARALGELGAATAGRAAIYRARCADSTPPIPTTDVQGRFAALWARGRDAAAALGVPFSGPVASELTAVLDELDSPGPFLALSNADAEANNILVYESGYADARLVDFEAAGFGHALLDAVCLYVPGPRWMSVGDPLADGLAEHYRRALAEAVPEAQDDRRYGFALAGACASWALLRLQRLAVLDARSPGDGSRLQLVHTLEAAARTADAHHALPRLAGWLWTAASVLRRRWPDADVDFTDSVKYPPYCPRE